MAAHISSPKVDRDHERGEMLGLSEHGGGAGDRCDHARDGEGGGDTPRVRPVAGGGRSGKRCRLTIYPDLVIKEAADGSRRLKGTGAVVRRDQWERPRGPMRGGGIRPSEQAGLRREIGRAHV